MDYNEFLRTKIDQDKECGFSIEESEINQKLFDWQRACVRWAVRKGRCALFEDCGMGKTPQQLEWARIVSKHEGAPILIIAPLAVSEQTKREGEKFGIEVNVCRTQDDVKNGINITNYEMLQHFNHGIFCGVVLDESSILKHHDSKTRTHIIESFKNTRYKLACTATPAPNDYMELGNHAEFLGVMSRTEMLSTFFVHDGGDTSKWRLKGHAQDKFWKWMSTWALSMRNPSDIGYDSTGYQLPALEIIQNTVNAEAGETQEGQLLLLPQIEEGLNGRRKARRNSLDDRCAMAAEIAKSSDDQCLVWCDLNDESGKLTELIDGSVEVRGSDSIDYKAKCMTDFAAGKIKVLVTKPSIAGFGMNWQNCHRMIFVGLSDSYEMFYQAVRRCWRFGQSHDVEAHVVISDAEGVVVDNIKRKEQAARKMTDSMVIYAEESLNGMLTGQWRKHDEYNPEMRMILPNWLVEVA